MSRRLLIPEIVQTSAVDCGPACLAALLAGFGLPASYGRLREACQTSVDGTSIDTMEQLANRLGLEAEQIVVPPDHVAIPEAGALPGYRGGAPAQRLHAFRGAVAQNRRQGADDGSDAGPALGGDR